MFTLVFLMLPSIIVSKQLKELNKASQDDTPHYSEGMFTAPLLSSLPLHTIAPGVMGMQQTSEVSSTASNPVRYTQVTSSVTVNSMVQTPDFIKELDELDAYMVNNTQFEEECQIPERLTYCTHIDYPVPKLLARAPFFQERMAQLGVAIEMLNLSTKGIRITTSCAKEVKEIICASKFPHCYEFKEMVRWEGGGKVCENKMKQCVKKAKNFDRSAALCERLNYTDTPTSECLLPESPKEHSLCKHQNVSTWLQHASLEVNSLLRFQFSLNKNLTAECKSNLTQYLCTFGLKCHTKENIKIYLKDIRKMCKDTNNLCENQVFSTAFKELLLDCQLLY